MSTVQKTLLATFLLALAIQSQSASGNEWVGGDGFWSDPANWGDNSVPGITDLVFIGAFESPVQDLLIQIDQPAFVEDLRIGNGNQLTNRVLPAGDAFPVSAQAALAIRGENILNPGPSQPAALFIYPSAAPVDLTASQVSLSADSELGLRLGAVANIGSSLLIGPDARLTGQGVVNFSGGFFTASNDGTIDAQGVMTINQLADALFDLDGTNESGKLFVGGNSFGDGGPQVNDHFTFNGTSLTDPFSGQLTLANDRHLTMNLTEGWTMDADSSISVGIDGATNQPATINGSHVTLEGELLLIAPQVAFERAAARFNADATINPSASVSLGTDAQLQFHGATTINGGEFTLAQGFTDLHFFEPTVVRGGVFSTHSDLHTDGQVTFRDPTEWDGEVTINGVARQMDDATVSGETTIHAQRFDMDGAPESPFQADWQLNSSLVVNAENINLEDDNVFDATMSISGGFVGRLTMNLTDPDNFWTMAGTLNLNNALPFGATRLAGSKIWLKGEVNVSGADIRVDADTRFAAETTTNFASASSSLGMQKKTRIDAGAMFTGEGTLINRTSGEMQLADGATLDETGLVNQGILMIGDSPGIASVDSLENTASGTWIVEIGGYLSGDQHDLLQVTGMDALLDGLLGVELIDAGSGLFLPEIGDEFTILTAVGNVSGTFDVEPVSVAAGKAFQWEVLYHPHDVTIRLVSIGPAVPEPTTLASLLLGTVPLGLAVRQRQLRLHRV